jgi:hypothetical protein
VSSSEAIDRRSLECTGSWSTPHPQISLPGPKEAGARAKGSFFCDAEGSRGVWRILRGWWA